MRPTNSTWFGVTAAADAWAEEVLVYWLETVGPDRWWSVGTSLDDDRLNLLVIKTLHDRFKDLLLIEPDIEKVGVHFLFLHEIIHDGSLLPVKKMLFGPHLQIPVDKDAHRVPAAPVPDVQLGIIIPGRTRAHQNCIFLRSPFMYQLP